MKPIPEGEVAAIEQHPVAGHEVIDTLQLAIDSIAAYTGEKVKHRINSYAMGADGVQINSTFVVLENYIAEVEIQIGGYEFDIGKLEMKTIRIKKYEVVYKTEEAEQQEIITKYDALKVEVYHNDLVHSTLNYIGDEPEDWLEQVLQVFPSEMMA